MQVNDSSADGVLVCIHDDDISRVATNADGSDVPSDTVFVSQSNYADLMNYDFGQKVNICYKGAKLPKLDDFLFYCGKVGMKPIFSLHSNFTDEKWQEIKSMLTRYGLLNSFTCKGAVVILESAYSVFGDEIAFYDTYYNSSQNVDDVIAAVNASTFAHNKDKVIIEVLCSAATKYDFDQILAAGYKAGVWDVMDTYGERYNELIRWGVTEFVDDRNCSYGLNW